MLFLKTWTSANPNDPIHHPPMQPVGSAGHPPPGPMVHPNQEKIMQPPPEQPIVHQPGGPMVPPGGSGPGGEPIMHQPGGPIQPPPAVVGPGPGGPIKGHGGRAWMEFPTAIPPDCPPGLEYLAALDTILVEQSMELFEIITGSKGRNRFLLMNVHGSQVFYATEQSGCCSRICFKARRGFIMSILDNAGNEVKGLFIRCQLFSTRFLGETPKIRMSDFAQTLPSCSTY